MSGEPKFIDGFLSELKATLSEEAGEIVLRRINTERLIRIVAQEFSDAHEKESVRVLSDSRIIGESDVDVLLQVDDYDIRIQLLDSPNEAIELNTEHLKRFHETLEVNPSTIALIIVWTTDDLLSLALTISLISHLIDNPINIKGALAEVKPLGSVLKEVVGSQSKQWDADIDLTKKKPSEFIDAHKQFLSEFERAVDDECKRSYRSTFRKLAAEKYPSPDERRLIEQCLQNALDGASADDLLRQLIKLGLRGE